jgi:hypothetical protein
LFLPEAIQAQLAPQGQPSQQSPKLRGRSSRSSLITSDSALTPSAGIARSSGN